MFTGEGDGSKEKIWKEYRNTLPETNSSPLKIDPLEVRRFLLEATVSRGELLVLRSVLLGKSTTQPCFVTEITVKHPNYPKLIWKVCCIADMFPTFLGWIFSMISGFQCSPVAWLEAFIPSPFKWSLSSMHLWFSWRFLVFSPHGGHQVNGNTTSSVIYHLKHLVHLGRLMAGTYTHHPWKERKMIWTIHLHDYAPAVNLQGV